MTDLKPCPYCGHKAHEEFAKYDETNNWSAWIACTHCPVSIFVGDQETRRMAVEKVRVYWNCREDSND